MTTPHQHAGILRAIADGKQIQDRASGSNSAWNDVSAAYVLQALSDDCHYVKFRVKPETIAINGIEVPEPVRVAPPDGTKYWFVVLSDIGHLWQGRDSDLLRLKQARCHLTQEAAEQHARALILASGGEV